MQKKKSSKKLKILKCWDFETFMLNHKHFYIDKTTWMREVLENKQRIQVYARPRLMGKSMNISMLWRFLDI